MKSYLKNNDNQNKVKELLKVIKCQMVYVVVLVGIFVNEIFPSGRIQSREIKLNDGK